MYDVVSAICVLCKVLKKIISCACMIENLNRLWIAYYNINELRRNL